MMQLSVETAWEKSERIATYVILVTLIAAELLSIGIPSLREILDRQGAVVLLALALLLVFRMVVRHLERSATSIESVTFGAGVSTATASARRKNELLIMANDGAKYYYHVSEYGLPALNAKVLLNDVSQVDRWTRLLERGLFSSLEIRHSPDRPILHFMVVGHESAMFGSFHRREGRNPTPGDTMLVSGRTADGRSFIQGLREIFESAWHDATPLSELQATVQGDRNESTQEGEKLL